MHEELSGRRLSHYELRGEIDRGGMGVVYRAQDLHTGEVVAIKVLPTFAGLDAGAVERFRREADAASRLAHPCIVPILALGEAEGIRYIVMELVDGPSLARLVAYLQNRDPARLTGSLAEETALCEASFMAREKRADTTLSGARYARSCAAIMADVAAALAVAHRAQVVHRDIKPSNILLRADGRPVLLDFGLARIESKTGLTLSGDAVGTPAYMAPEQARGERHADGRIDVYGMGATLYELLTLRAPFDGAHAGEIMRSILDDEPVPVRQYNPRVPRDLATIVHACLQKDPARRYPSADALERDLRNFLDGRRIWASPPTSIERVSRWMQRHRTAAAMTMLVVCLSAVLLSTVAVVSIRNRQEQGETALERAADHLFSGRIQDAVSAYTEASELLADPRRVDTVHLAHVRMLIERDPSSRQLGSAIASLPPGEQQGMLDLRERLTGQGRLRIKAPPDLRVHMRRIEEGRLLARTRLVGRERDLSAGRYLASFEGPGLAPSVRVVEVERDQETRIVPSTRSPAELGGGMALVTIVGRDLAMARLETTAGDLQRLLGLMEDEHLRKAFAVLVPMELDRPLHGLSPWHARTLAQALGGVIPTGEEWLAGARSGLSEWRYPFGPAFDPRLVAADPDRMSGPLAADSLPAGASPAGLQHMLGNVEEYVLRPSGAIQLRGGCWQSPPGTLDLEALRAVPDFVTSQSTAGLRLARLLPQPDTGTPPGPEVKALFRIENDGFVQLHRRGTTDLVLLDLFEPLDPEASSVSQRLRPLRGLRADRFQFVFELPEQGEAVAVALPPAAVVDEVESGAVTMAITGGAVVCTAAPFTPLRFRFRHNGGLTIKPPAHGPWVARAVESLTATGNWSGIQVTDVSAIADVTTVTALATRHLKRREGGVLLVPRVPVRLLFRNDEPVRILLDSESDQGLLDAHGYLNEGLKVRVMNGQKARMQMLADGVGVLQLRIQHTEDPRLFLEIRGCLAPEGLHDPEVLEAALSGGRSILEEARLLTGGRVSGIGPMSHPFPALQTRHRLVRDGQEHFRERWTLVQVGRRWLFLRAVARADDAAAARDLYTQAESWFDALLGNVRFL